MQGGADSEQHPSGAGGQVHGQPEQLLTGERRAALVVDRVPGQPADVIVDDTIPRATTVAQIQDHAGAPGEQTRRDIERRPRHAADPADSLDELVVVVSVSEVLVEDDPNTGTAVSEVRHGPPALVDFHAPVVADHAASEVLPQRSARQVEQGWLAHLLIKTDEQPGRT